SDARVFPFQVAAQRVGSIGRGVVADDDLDRAVVLTEDARQALFERRDAVVRRDGDGHQRIHSTLGSGIGTTKRPPRSLNSFICLMISSLKFHASRSMCVGAVPFIQCSTGFTGM